MSAIQRVRRESKHGITYNELSVEAYQRTQRTLESQIGLELTPSRRERKKINGKRWYALNRTEVINRGVKRIKANLKKRREWEARYRLKNRAILNEKHKQWRKDNAEKARESTRRYREKIKSKITADEIKAIGRLAYQRNRAVMIERHGLDGWRDICNRRNKATRRAKRQKLLTQEGQ